MIVACTGHSEPEYIQKAWRSEMDEVVPKPTDIEVIKSILSDIIIDHDKTKWSSIHNL